MKRDLLFNIYADAPLDEDKERELFVAQTLVNRRFLRSNRLSTDFLSGPCKDPHHAGFNIDGKELPCVAHGDLLERENEWETFVAAEWLFWASRLLPHAWIQIADTEPLFCNRFMLLHEGKVQLDGASAQKWAERLRSEKQEYLAEIFEEWHARLTAKELLGPPPVSAVAKDQMLAGVKIPKRLLREPVSRLVDEGYIEFPWQTVWMKGTTS